MNAKELGLAVAFLRQAADDAGCKGCNDWEFPDDWTQDERTQFVKEYHDYNGDPEEFNPAHIRLPDFAAIAFIAHKLATAQ